MISGVNTKIVVRVQAKGGKFLGDDIGGACVVIRHSVTGQILASGVTRGDSGELTAAYSSNASQSAIITPAQAKAASGETIHWLHAGVSTSNFTADIELDVPALLEFTVFGSRGGLQTAHAVSTTQWVVPGSDLTAGPGFVIEIPGLLLQVMQPATHSELSLTNGPITLAMQANVTMMCGCPISWEKPWLPSDFAVNVDIANVATGHSLRVPLTFDNNKDAPPSIFNGSHEVSEAGTYEATFSAVQHSTGNTGAGLVTFTVNK